MKRTRILGVMDGNKNIQDFKMKIIVFGDIHGRDVWKKVLDERIDEVDKVIFLGDYFTSREGINEYKQNLNFLEILKYKELFDKYGF